MGRATLDGPMRVAIVHDYLTQRGGAERVVLAMARAFPGAPIYTSLYEPGTTFSAFRELDVRPSPLNRVRLLRRNHRLGLPLYAACFSAMRVDADVVVCSSSGWAHGVSTSRGARRIVYCHNPPRWLYQLDDYAPSRRSAAHLSARLLSRSLLAWDRRAAALAASYLANSSVVAARVGDVYGRSAEVIPPPPALTPNGKVEPVSSVEEPFALCVSRLLPYKNVGAVVEAFRQLGDLRLVVVGLGPLFRQLEWQAPENVSLIGAATDAQLRWLYTRCDALIAPAREDFGLTPLEAASFGKPSAVLRWGGYLDTMTDRTAVFFETPDPSAIAHAVREVRARAWDAREISEAVDRFGERRFIDRLRAIVARVEGEASSDVP